MNRQDITKEIARREALAAEWTASAELLRAELEKDALAEHEANSKAGVTWKWTDFARVTLPLSNEAVAIDDITALRKWVRERYPEHIETVEQVIASFQAWLLKHAVITDEGLVVDPRTGEVIPGMAVREGGKPKSLSITLERPAKDLFRNYARDEVARQLAAEYGPQESSVSDPDGA